MRRVETSGSTRTRVQHIFRDGSVTEKEWVKGWAALRSDWNWEGRGRWRGGRLRRQGARREEGGETSTEKRFVEGQEGAGISAAPDRWRKKRVMKVFSFENRIFGGFDMKKLKLQLKASKSGVTNLFETEAYFNGTKWYEGCHRTCLLKTS